MTRTFMTLGMALLGLAPCAAHAQPALPQPTLVPPFQTLDLNLGESQEVTIADRKVVVKLVDLKEQSDSLRKAVRRAEVQVEIGGRPVTLASANYNLPVTVGDVQIDCPITRGYTRNSTKTTGGLAPWGQQCDLDAMDRLELQLPASQGARIL